MEDIIIKVAEKVRKMYNRDNRVKHLLSKSYTVELEMKENDKIRIKSIIWRDAYDKLCAYPKELVFHDYGDKPFVLINYKDFNEFLNF